MTKTVDVISTTEIAHRLGVSDRTVRRYTRDGSIPSRIVGGRRIVLRSDYEAWLRSAA